jgi:hypothetical protein
MEQQEEKTVVLRKPIVVGDVTYAELNLREATAGEMSKATRYGGSNNIDVAISLISQLARVPMLVAQGLSQRDFQECNDFLGSFDTGLETGEMSSPS